MPRESNQTVEQIFRTASSVLTALVLGILYLLAGDSVHAQQFYLPPPNLAPSRPSTYAGVFYMNAGIRFRNIQEVSFKTKEQELTNITVPGTPVFGPLRDDMSVGYPDSPALLSTDPNASGYWVYDDGYIVPYGGAAGGYKVAPTDPPTATSPNGYLVPFPGGGIGLGRITAYEGTAPVDNGMWGVHDYYLQFNSESYNPYVTTSAQRVPFNTFRTASFSALLTNQNPERTGETVSQGFNVTVTPEIETRSTNKMLTPFLEAGYQFGNFFDLFMGFSWFDITESFGRTVPKNVYAARRGYRDTFPIQITQTSASVPNYLDSGSGTFITEENTLVSYVLFPLGLSVPGSEMAPRRVFYSAMDPNGPTFQANEILNSTLDFSLYEIRPGLRSWYPLFGLGRVATTLGGLMAPMDYRVATNARYVATAAEGTFEVAAGDTLLNVTNVHKDVYWNWGVFGGAELEIGGNSVYFKGAAEYNWHFNPLKYGDITEVKVNIGGFSASATIGARF